MLLVLEWLILFVGFPILAWLDLWPVSIFLIFALPVLYSLLVAFFSPRVVLEKRPVSWPRFALGMTVVVAAIFGFCALFYPDRFLYLPRRHPSLWLTIMIFYPLVSAWPQEFLYRRFYFNRYRRLFPARTLAATSNIGAFAFLHVIFDNWIAIVFTALGGALFTFTYLRTNRLVLVWIEHAVYGLAIFTSGLGTFFYAPIPTGS